MEYIFKHTGKEKLNARKITALLKSQNLTLLNKDNFPNVFLVKVDKKDILEKIKEQLPGDWDIFLNKKGFKIPTTKPSKLSK